MAAARCNWPPVRAYFARGHHVIREDRGAQTTLTPNQADLLRLLLERPGEDPL